jgi:predicted nucleic acid-binding Zn ribbon protein
MSRRPDRTADQRRANAADRDERLYARKRASQERRRASQERRAFDPAPPDPDDWVIEDADGAGLRRLGPPSDLRTALEGLVRRRGWTERLRSSAAWGNWDEIVGADLAQRCEPVRLAGGVLVVRAESQVWATQLRYLLPQLRANAEAVLGSGTVRSVRVVIGPLEGRTAPDVTSDVGSGEGAEVHAGVDADRPGRGPEQPGAPGRRGSAPPPDPDDRHGAQG